MSERTIRVVIDPSRARDGARVIKRDLSDIDGSARRAQGGVNLLRNALVALGGIVAFRSLARTILDFEDSLARVRAVTQATTRQMLAMENAARDLGATTQFSASQAASGMEFLGRAGFDTTQIVTAMPSVLNLAAAASLDLGNAADITSNIMSAFGIAAERSAEIADVLALAASRANTDVGQLGDAMRFVGPVASAMGVEMSDAAAAVGALSNAGIQGSMAGTGLRRVLSSLANPTGAAASALRDLNINLEDVNPATNELVDIVQRLSDGGLTAADSLTIFGDRGGPAILALTEQIPQLRELTGELRDAGGTAEEMADIMQDTTAGALREMRSATEALTLSIGNSGLNEAMRSAVEGVTSLLRVIGSNLTPILRTATDVAGGLAAILAGRLAGSVGAAAIAMARANIEAILYQATLARMAGVTKAAAIGQTALAGTVGVLRGALALVGGPLGAAITGLSLLFFWTQRNKSIADDLQPSVRSIRELADEAARLRSGGALMTPEQTESIARAREEIERGAKAISILTEQRNQALAAGDERVAAELLGVINNVLRGIEDRSNAIRELESSLSGAGIAAGGFGDGVVGAATDLETLADNAREIAIMSRQLELMASGVSAAAAAQQAQAEFSSQAENALADLRREVEQVTQREADMDAALARNQALITGVSDETRRYQATLTDLSELLARGRISQDEFNAAVGRLDAGGASGNLTELRQELDSLDFGSQFAQGFDDASRAAGDLLDGINGLISAQSTFADLRAKAGDDEAALSRIAQKEQQSQIGLFGDMTQAAKGFFDEGSDGYKALTAAEQAFRAIELVLAAQNIAQKLGLIATEEAAVVASAATKASAEGSAAVASAGVGTPFPANLAAISATIAALAAVGVTLSGSGGGGGRAPANSGTVFGDPLALSESIANSVSISAEADEAILGVNRQMLQSLRSLEAGLAAAANLFARTELGLGPGPSGPSRLQNQLTGIALTGPFGAGAFAADRLSGAAASAVSTILPGALGDILGGVLDGIGGVLGGILGGIGGFFSGRPKIKDEGVQILGGAFDDLLEDITVEAFRDIKIRRRFRSNKRRFETQEIAGEIDSQFELIIGAIGDSVISAAQALRIDESAIDAALAGLQVDTIRISTRNLSGEEVAEQVDAAFSNLFDQVARAVVPFLDEFARIGEGAGETLTRIASNVGVAEAGLERLGLTIDASVIRRATQTVDEFFGTTRRIAFEFVELDPERLARISTALIDAAGGLQEFGDLTAQFVSDFKSEAEQIDILRGEIGGVFGDLGVALPRTRDQFVSLIEGFEVNDEASAQLLAQLLELAPALDQVFDAAEKIAEERTDLELRLLRATGTELEVLAAEREREILALDESNRALLQQIFSAEDAARAAEDAARAERELAQAQAATASASLDVLRAFDLAPSAFDEVVDSLGLVIDQLPRTAAAMGEFLLSLSDAQRAALQPFIGELQGLIAEQAAVDSGRTTGSGPQLGGTVPVGFAPVRTNQQPLRDALRQAFDRESQALQQTVQQFDTLRESLNAFAAELSPASSQFDALSGSFAELARQARLGDLDALEQLPSVGRDFVTQIEQTATSRLDLDRQVAAVRREILAAEEVAGRQGNIAQQQLEELRDQVSALISIEEAVVSVEDAIRSLTGRGFASGGIASGPSSGFLTALHDTEAVVPLPDGRSIPVVTNSDATDRRLERIERQVAALTQATENGLRNIALHTARTAKNTRNTSDTLEDWDVNGQPVERAA